MLPPLRPLRTVSAEQRFASPYSYGSEARKLHPCNALRDSSCLIAHQCSRLLVLQGRFAVIRTAEISHTI